MTFLLLFHLVYTKKQVFNYKSLIIEILRRTEWHALFLEIHFNVKSFERLVFIHKAEIESSSLLAIIRSLWALSSV